MDGSDLQDFLSNTYIGTQKLPTDKLTFKWKRLLQGIQGARGHSPSIDKRYDIQDGYP